jgi:hypothetical protein
MVKLLFLLNLMLKLIRNRMHTMHASSYDSTSLPKKRNRQRKAERKSLRELAGEPPHVVAQRMRELKASLRANTFKIKF